MADSINDFDEIRKKISDKDSRYNLSFIPLAISLAIVLCCYFFSFPFFYLLSILPLEKRYGHSGFGLAVEIASWGFFLIGLSISLIASIVKKSKIIFYIFCLIPILLLLILKIYSSIILKTE